MSSTEANRLTPNDQPLFPNRADTKTVWPPVEQTETYPLYAEPDEEQIAGDDTQQSLQERAVAGELADIGYARRLLDRINIPKPTYKQLEAARSGRRKAIWLSGLSYVEDSAELIEFADTVMGIDGTHQETLSFQARCSLSDDEAFREAILPMVINENVNSPDFEASSISLEIAYLQRMIIRKWSAYEAVKRSGTVSDTDIKLVFDGIVAASLPDLRRTVKPN